MQLAQLGEALAATKKKLEHRVLIGAYLRSLPPDEIAIAARLIIGRVFPESDARVLNVSGSAITQAVETLTGATLDWGAIGAAVDYGDAIERWLTSRGYAAQGEPLGLLEVYRAYETIAADNGPGSRERKQAHILAVLRRATPLEAKYLVKQLVREMRVGVNELSLLDAIAGVSGVPSRVIRRANQVGGDVGEVARAALLSGEPGLMRMSVKVGSPLKPMLAQPAEDVADGIAKAGGPQNLALEYKLDGVRVQVHKRGEHVWLFSRNLSDITASLPDVVEAVQQGVPADTVILDGEVIALSQSGRPRAFQDVLRRVGREREIEAFQEDIALTLFVFDVLVVGDAVLLDLPNSARWETLQAVRGALASVPRLVPQDIEDGQAFLKRARDAGHEGLVAKTLASHYTPGERGKYWFKIKPVVTLDLVIVAAEWGYGRRTGWLSNVHLAARDEDTGELVDVGKTFKGLTDEQFKVLTQTLLASKTHARGNTVFVKPAVVVEVAFNNVQRSTRYKSGVALRLARIINFRPDKSPDDVETVQTLRRLMAAERGQDEKER